MSKWPRYRRRRYRLRYYYRRFIIASPYRPVLARILRLRINFITRRFTVSFTTPPPLYARDNTPGNKILRSVRPLTYIYLSTPRTPSVGTAPRLFYVARCCLVVIGYVPACCRGGSSTAPLRGKSSRLAGRSAFASAGPPRLASFAVPAA